MRSWPEPITWMLVVIGLTACESLPAETEEIPLDEVETLSERPCEEDSYLTYENFGGPFMLTWCNGCHSSSLPDGERQGAPLGSNFDSLEDIRDRMDDIWDRAGDHNDTMPPVAGPEPDERTQLGEWLACSAP